MEARKFDDAALVPHLLAHYDHAAPLIAAHFADEPIVFANFPPGFHGQPHFAVTEIPLSASRLLWCVHRYYAVEFHSWAGLVTDEDRLRFGRILIEARQTPWHLVREAATLLRAALARENIAAIPLADGLGGIALWIPLSDAPHAVAVRAWLHGVVNPVVAAHPALLSNQPNTHDPNRVHIHVSSNARGRYSALPYSLRGAPSLPMCTPIAWDELATIGAVACTAAEFPDRLKSHGDRFARQIAEIGAQTMPLPAMAVSPGHTPEPRGRIINAAIDILSDGVARDAQTLCAEAIERGLIPKTTLRKYVYSALIEYIARAIGRGRKSPIVQDEQRNFRINEPADDWPVLAPQAATPDDARTQALCERLTTTATGDDPTAFEIAVCDAFAQLGFLTTHLGGHDQADGIADAVLGPLGYRVAIECKSAKTIVTQPDCAEVAKEIAELQADYGVIVGPAFSDESELLSELQTHKVTALTTSDLIALLGIAATPVELRAVILVPGYASDVLGDLLWQRRHGQAKRVTTIAAILQREGWNAQRTAAQQGGAANAPHLTVDAAMLLVDAVLHAAGSKQACTHDDVTLAIAWLTNPIESAGVIAGDALVVFDGDSCHSV